MLYVIYAALFCYVTKVVRNIKCMLYNISQPSRCQFCAKYLQDSFLLIFLIYFYLLFFVYNLLKPLYRLKELLNSIAVMALTGRLQPMDTVKVNVMTRYCSDSNEHYSSGLGCEQEGRT